MKLTEQTQDVGFVVNGLPVRISTDPERTLLNLLREDLKLTGVKDGCSQGHCGTCTVLVDGEPTLSCRTKVEEVAGKEVVTIEGLGTPDNPHPIQRAFVEAGAVQCGFCTPGAILSAKALLDRTPLPTRAEIMAALNRNLCRCTGYAKVIEAVNVAAAYLTETRPSEERERPAAVRSSGENHAVGVGFPGREAWQKATGTARFAADYEIAGALYGVAVRSPHPHAKINSVAKEEALAVPGVHAVLTAKDVPGRNAVAIFRPDQPILAEGKVRYEGEPVALVLADTLEAAKAGRDAVRVEYDPLPAVFDPDEAGSQGAPRIHDDVENEVFARRLVRGDVRSALENAEVVVEGSYSSPYNEHAYLEPEAGIGYLEEGTLVVMTGTQNAQHLRQELAKVLAVDDERVRVVQTTTGGGFGGRLDVSFPGLVAVGAWVTGRPVRVVLTREESFASTTKRHPFVMRARLGASSSGEMTALEFDFTANTGAYLSFGPGVVTRAVVHAPGPYRIPHVSVYGRAVHTNGPTAGAMRGFGVPQVTFALECLVDELAERVGVDSLELRRLNGFRGGDVTATGQSLEAGAAYLDTLDALEPAYRAARQEAEEFNVSAEAEDRAERRGVGLASMWFGPGKTSLPEKSYAFVELLDGGEVRVVTTASDVGQGLQTVMGQIVAEELNLPYSAVEVVANDTAGSPDGGFTCASRQTYNTGNAVLEAARLLRRAALSAAGEMLGEAEGRLVLDGGAVQVAGDGGERVGFAELAQSGLARRFFGSYAAEVSDLDDEGQGRPYETYTFGSQLVTVEVNVDRFRTRVVDAVVAHDVGTAINPQAVEGQLEGGVLMGVGFALKEEYFPGKTKNFAQYRIPRASDAPTIRVIHLDTPHERGPFGAAGAGECAQMPTAPAIVNALAQAVGVRARDLPVTPQKLRGIAGRDFLGHSG